MNPTNMEIAMMAVLCMGMVFGLYVLIRAIAYHDSTPLEGSFNSEWGRK